MSAPGANGKPNRRLVSAIGWARHKVWQVLVLLTATLVLSSCGNWRGIANIPLPGGPGTGSGSYTVYVQMPDTLALNGNSRVLVADVFVGRVRAINLKDWVAVLTLDLQKGVHLPKNATAKIGQTSLLGSQHVELAAPPDPSRQRLENGDTIPLKSSSAYPTIERTLAAFATTLHGGGIPNLDVLQNEVYNVLNGRAPQIREFLGKLDTFTAQLNQQRDDIVRTIDSTNRLLTYVASRSDTLNQVLTDFPPLVKHLADTRQLFIDAFDALGRLGDVSGSALSATRDDLNRNLQLLQRPLKQLARSAPNLIGALGLILTLPFNVDDVPKIIRGDYINVSGYVDLTYSTLDNAILTGTGFSGALRALEQSFGRDPASMIPDVRYTPNPNDAPGGPLVERGE